MSPLEAARKIMADGPRLIEDLWCALCQQPMESRSFIEAQPHAPDCPWLEVPQIVAALEAAQAFVDSECWCSDEQCDVCSNLLAALNGRRS